MTLWFVLALMTAAAIFAVLWPLSRGDRAPRSGSDVAVYRDQLDEIRRDQAAGLIGESEAAAAQVEVSRRLHRGRRRRGGALCRRRPPPRRCGGGRLRSRRSRCCRSARSRSISRSARPCCPASRWRTRGPAERQTIEQMVAQVEAHLAKNPDEGRGWEVVAPIYLRMGRFEDAVKARRRVLELNGPSADRHAGLGEALTAAANGVVTAEALAAFKAAVALDADHVMARFFLGLAAEQDGRANDAIAIWRALLDERAAGCAAGRNSSAASWSASVALRMVDRLANRAAARARSRSPPRRTCRPSSGSP